MSCVRLCTAAAFVVLSVAYQDPARAQFTDAERQRIIDAVHQDPKLQAQLSEFLAGQQKAKRQKSAPASAATSSQTKVSAQTGANAGATPLPSPPPVLTCILRVLVSCCGTIGRIWVF